ncbi:MAG: hypothetical protein ABW116_17240 [Candidatus Sedimenticola sp. 20ELBAFRAG]
MKKLLNVFIDICLLRAAPQDLPASGFLMLWAAALGLVTGTVVIVDDFGGPANALLAQLMDLALMMSLLRLGLVLSGKGARFVQSATALFGTGIVVNLVSMPLLLMMGDDPAASPLGGLGVLLFMFLAVWAIVIIAHILRHAFEITFLGGSTIAILYFFLINGLVQALFLGG